MSEEQLSLFSKKKFPAGVQQPLGEIKPPTKDSSVLGSLPAYHLSLKEGSTSKYTADDFLGDVKKFGVYVRDKTLAEITARDILAWKVALQACQCDSDGKVLCAI